MTSVDWAPVRSLRVGDTILHEGRACAIDSLVHEVARSGTHLIVVKAGPFQLGLEPGGTMPVVARAVTREAVGA